MALVYEFKDGFVMTGLSDMDYDFLKWLDTEAFPETLETEDRDYELRKLPDGKWLLTESQYRVVDDEGTMGDDLVQEITIADAPEFTKKYPGQEWYTFQFEG